MQNTLYVHDIISKVLQGHRITVQEAYSIYQNLDWITLGNLAHQIRNKLNPKPIVSYIVDRNINYTNVCVTRCQFCAFYRNLKHPQAYVLDDQTIQNKVLETQTLGGTGILMQGGLHPKLKLDYYVHLLSLIKKTAQIHIHAFSPEEIVFLSKLEKKSIKNILLQLIQAGLDSIPGGGAEILIDSVRKQISPRKCSSQQWLNVMEIAHNLNLKTTATMMFGHAETILDRIHHLDKIRHLQDKTAGFTAFIPWTFQQKDMKLLPTPPVFGHEYLKTLALSRIFLDNFKNIQGSWVAQGEEIGQLSLYFGANDLGSIMIEENVVQSAGTSFHMNEQKMQSMILQSGFQPFKRNTLYTNLT